MDYIDEALEELKTRTRLDNFDERFHGESAPRKLSIEFGIISGLVDIIDKAMKNGHIPHQWKGNDS